MGENGGWNEALIRAHFLPADAAEILRIALPNVPTMDKLLRHFTRSGVYLAPPCSS